MGPQKGHNTIQAAFTLILLVGILLCSSLRLQPGWTAPVLLHGAAGIDSSRQRHAPLAVRLLTESPTNATCPPDPGTCNPKLPRTCEEVQYGPMSPAYLSSDVYHYYYDKQFSDWDIHCHLDLRGHDLGEMPEHRAAVKHIRECAANCKAVADCKAFTYSYENASVDGTFNCWLKSTDEIHDDSNVREVKRRTDCCIDLVTVRRPKPWGDFSAKFDKFFKEPVNSFVQTFMLALALVTLIITLIKNKARESTAMDALFHKYDAIEKHVDALHAALYKPKANGTAATARTVAARAANLCDMATGMPLDAAAWKAAVTAVPAAARAAAVAAAGGAAAAAPAAGNAAAAAALAACPNPRSDMCVAKRGVNAWLEDVCYHTKGVGAKETPRQAFERWLAQLCCCECSLGRSRDALQVIDQDSIHDFTYRVERCAAAVEPLNWVWAQINNPPYYNVFPPKEPEDNKIARHPSDIYCAELLLKVCKLKTTAANTWTNPAFIDFLQAVLPEEHGSTNYTAEYYRVTGAKATTVNAVGRRGGMH